MDTDFTPDRFLQKRHPPDDLRGPDLVLWFAREISRLLHAIIVNLDPPQTIQDLDDFQKEVRERARNQDWGEPITDLQVLARRCARSDDPGFINQLVGFGMLAQESIADIREHVDPSEGHLRALVRAIYEAVDELHGVGCAPLGLLDLCTQAQTAWVRHDYADMFDATTLIFARIEHATALSGHSLGKGAPPPPPISQSLLTALQVTILDALDGRVLRKEDLAARCECSDRKLYGAGGLNDLTMAGRVKNNRKIGGYYRPDKPPPEHRAD